MDDFKDVVDKRLKEVLTGLNDRLIETDREESWEAISHNKVSTLVEGSVGSLTERLTELEHTVQSQRTTPVTEDDVLNMETWSALEQVKFGLSWARLRSKCRKFRTYTLCVRSLIRIRRFKRDNWKDCEVLLDE